ncbi:hypothetical protein HF086_006211 [Spodoptera exigua]|uniref:Uncharacterized protein n=1 Tax=Spodoptera exigua TaxID=7107 RepID=A0A922MDE9_SPOEX|nr:hypothetical protein HF086_006211 [Spodoptera exigua]
MLVLSKRLASSSSESNLNSLVCDYCYDEVNCVCLLVLGGFGGIPITYYQNPLLTWRRALDHKNNASTNHVLRILRVGAPRPCFWWYCPEVHQQTHTTTTYQNTITNNGNHNVIYVGGGDLGKIFGQLFLLY